MTLATPPQSTTWTYLDGDWHPGNVAIIGPRSHAIWQGSSVFDGARRFEGVAPDLLQHCARVNASASALGLTPFVPVPDIVGLAQDGFRKFEQNTALYIRPMYWAEHGDHMGVPADPKSTRFFLCLHEAPMPPADGMSIGLSPYRRPTPETMPTDAKTGGLYPNNARATRHARGRGFDNALVLDMLGNVAETATSNLFLVKDRQVYTPVANGCFLAGITRSRVMGLLSGAGYSIVEKTLGIADFLSADEAFSTGNYAKVTPVTQIEDHSMPVGPVSRLARSLYWEWAHSTAS